MPNDSRGVKLQAVSSIHKEKQAKRAIVKHLATKDLKIVDEVYRSFAPLFPRVPYVTDEAIRSALSVTDHPKAATAAPKEFYDNRFLKELESTGFVKELYSAR